MSNFKSDILAAAGDERIIAIAVGRNRRVGPWGDWGGENADHALGDLPVEWSAAAPVLDYEYDAGIGKQDCHNIWAWTQTRVLSIHENDGSTSVISVPRNPADFAAWQGAQSHAFSTEWPKSGS